MTLDTLVVLGFAMVSSIIGTIWLYRITRSEEDAALWRFRGR